MSAREAIFLGTASQVPTRHRNHNALFLRWDNLGVLFDPGEGTQRQLLIAGVAATQITHICITHFHGDHCLGLAALVQRLSLDRVPHPVEIIYPESGQVFFERLRYAAIYHEQATLVPRPIRRRAADPEGEILVAAQGSVRIVARPLEQLAAHGVQGPAIKELMQHGQLTIGDRTVHLDEVSEPRPGQSFALVMDTRPCPGAQALAQGADLLVCESTFTSEHADEAHEYRHMTAAQAATLAHEAGARTLALTHFSQRYTRLDGFFTEASAIHPEVVVAQDFTIVKVPARRP